MRDVYKVREKIIFINRHGDEQYTVQFNNGTVYGDIKKLHLPCKYSKCCEDISVSVDDTNFAEIKCVFNTFEQAYGFFSEAGFYSVYTGETMFKHKKKIMLDDLYRITEKNFFKMIFIEEYHLDHATSLRSLSETLSHRDFILYCQDNGIALNTKRISILNENKIS